MLPDDSPEYVTSTLQRVVGDSAVHIVMDGEPLRSPPSPLRADLMQSVTAITSAMWPGAHAVPMMVMGATDGMYLRAAGIPTYGVQGFFYEPADIRFHGRDERLGVTSFYDGVNFMYDLVKRLSS